MRFFFGLKKTFLLVGFLVLSFTWLSSFDFSASAQKNFGMAKKASSEFSGAEKIGYKNGKIAADVASSVFAQQAKLTGNDSAAQDNLGFSAAISGDTAIVGAPRNSGGANLQARGAAYVYVRNTSGAWTQQQKLVPSDGAATDQFGYSVAINGNTAAVGRYNTTTGQNRADGKVYIFTRNGTTWTETQTLVSNDLAQGDSFGYALAFDGDTLAVGARNKNNNLTFFQGAAYIFTRPSGSGNFTQQAKLTASDGGQSDFFGESVSLSGDTAIIGSVNDFGQTNARGKAYVFVRSGSTWTEQQILQANGSAANDGFGTSVSVSGDTAVIGANTEPIGTTGELGAAYIFQRSGTTWTQQQKLTGQEATPRNDRFGYAVAVKGDTIAVGSPAHEYLPGIANHGAVYVYQRSGANWTRAQKLVHNDPTADALGQSLAFDGISIISGAPSKNSARGAAYIFASLRTNAQKIFDSNGEGDDYFGSDVAASGDTMVIGAQQDDNGTNGGNQGSASVYVRDAAGNWVFQQKLLAADGVGGDFFGASVAISGNTIVIGAFFEDSGTTSNNGAAYVFTKNGGTWTQQAKLLASDPIDFGDFGRSVAIDGDTIAVGSPEVDTAVNNRGAVYVYTRSGATWTQQAKLMAAGATANEMMGGEVSLSGDTIFATFQGFNAERGGVYVFNRSGTAWTEGQKLSGSAEDYLGSSVAVRGDEAMIGGARANDNLNRGAVFYYTRANGVWTERQVIAPTGASISAEFGTSVAFEDTTLIVGARQDYDATRAPVSGAAYVFRKFGSTWTQTKRFIAFDAEQNANLGKSVTVSGSQGIAGAPTDRVNGQNTQGSVYVFSTASKNNVADFDGDGRVDLSVFRASEANWFTRRSSNSAFSAVQWGLSTDKPTPADFDGDGRTDYAVWRENGVGDPQRSYFFILRSSDNTLQTEQFGSAGDNPNVVGDWDGDGKNDVAVYRAGTSGGQSYFYYRPSSQPNVDFVSIAWGSGADKAVRGDFDGDDKLDAAVFRPSDRVWYVRRSGDGVLQTMNWGLSDDKLVPADYDGDGKTDFAVFRPSDRTWYISPSANGQFTAVTFGLSSDVLAPADYDGDGKTDIAVYRGGSWIIRQSANGNVRYDNFGTNADVPTVSAHLQ